ncbi:uncharacterized protein LOC128219862 [Mya arenaria]|uniref:uncharacterized protein LOC128219862 n=1 Tax=Mya arenaria TaxID=6604 RepID=UPI0022E5E290|nr:uncharacterized protein LOC128219862 [Mya arenaria]
MAKELIISTILWAICISCTVGIDDKALVWTSKSSETYLTDKLNEWVEDTDYPWTIYSMNMSKLSMGYGLAVDTHTGHAIISDPGNNLLVIVDLNKELAAFFYVGTSKGVGQVTIDWRARNVYWTDAGFGWIAMKALPKNITSHNSLDTRMKVIVDHQLETPTGIVVHPHKYYLFWADAGKHPKIERSDMTGNGRIVIVWQGLITPRALAIDNQGDKLFWTDEDRETIEFCNFDGTGRNILISNGLQYYGIDVYQSYVFYSAFYRETANTTYTGYIHTTNWKDQSHRVLQNKTLYHVAVYDRASQPRDPLGERCENAYTNCSQICIHEDDNGNTACLCLDGYDLDRFQGRACYDGGYNVERHLLFTNSHSICAIAINAFTAHDSIKGFPYNCSVIRGSYGEITRFSIDTAGRNIFFTNSTHILMQTPFLSEKRTVYSSNGTKITDMDFDWLTRTLYWIESDSSALHFIKPYSTETSIKLKKLRENGQLTNLAVDPLNRKIYFVVRSRDDSFELNVYDAATETVTTVEVNNLRRPTDLEYDRLQERLVWNDDGGFIGFLALGDRKQIPKVETNGGKKRHAITPYKQFIFSSTEEAKRQFDVLYEGDQSMIYTSFSSIYDTFVHDMHVYDKTLQPSETGPCDVRNGGCQHYCISNATEECACKVGYILSNEKNCTTRKLDSEYFIILDQIHGRLFQATKTDFSSEVYAVDIHTDNAPVSLAFDSDSSTIAWVDESITRTVKVKKLGQNDERIVEFNMMENGYVAIDSSTGNVYVLSANKINVINENGKVHELVDDSLTENIEMKTIALLSSHGKMAWIATQTGRWMIFLANMDRTNRKLAIQSESMIDDLIFDVETGDSLYWCEAKTDKVGRYAIETRQEKMVYSDGGLQPIALDVAGEYVYVVPYRGRRIVRMSKSDGSGQKTVFENPLLGSLNNFFVSHSGPLSVHSQCGECNGQCSDICLPDGVDGRTCACDLGDELNDATNCRKSSRCPVVEEESISVLDDCCPEQPDALCKVTCADGFTQVSPYKLKCQPTGWNASIEELCTEGSKPPNTWLMIGIASFALVLVVIAVVAFIIHRKRSSKFDRLDEQYVVAYRHDILAYDSDHVYDPANAIARNKSADRNSRVQSECYADLDETVILAESVDLPTKHEKQSRGRNDYHPFPTSQIVPPNLPDREKTAPLMDVQKSLSKGLSYVSFDSNVYDISIDDQYDRLGSNRLSRSLKVASGYGSTQNVSMRGQSINEGPANPQNHYSTLLKYKKDNEFSAFANDNEGFSNKQSASFVNPSFEDDECTCGVVEFTEESSVPHQANFVINGGETEFNDETDYMEASDSKDMEYLSNEKRWRRKNTYHPFPGPLDNSTSEEQSFKKQNSRSGNDCQQRNDLPVIDEKTGSNRGQNVYHPFPSSEDLSRDLSTEGTEFHVNATIATGVNHVKEIETDDYMKPLDYQHGMVKETKLLERRLQNHDRSHNHYHPFPSSECLSTFSPDNDPDSNYENPNFVEDDNLTERHGGEAGKPHKFSDPSTVDIQRVLDSMHPACQKPDCSSNVDAADNIRISKHDSNYQLPDDYFDGYVEDNLHPPSIPDSKNNLTIQNHSHETNSMIPRENVRCNESPQNAKDLGLNPISKRCVPVGESFSLKSQSSADYLDMTVIEQGRFSNVNEHIQPGNKQIKGHKRQNHKQVYLSDDDDDDYLTPVPGGKTGTKAENIDSNIFSDEGSDDYLTLVVNTEARDGKGIEMQQHIDHKHQNNSKNKVAKNSNMTDKTNDYIPMDKYRLETEPEFKANAAAERENIIPMKQNIHDIKHYQEGYSCLENNKKSSDDDYFAMDRFRAKTYHNPKLMHSLAADNENVERENGASVGHNENVDGKWCISTNKRKAEMGPFQNQNSYMEAEAAHDEMDDYLPMKTSISETDDNRGDDYLPMNSSKAEADNNEGDDYLPMKGLKAKADGNEGDDYLPMNKFESQADENEGDDYLPMNSSKAKADDNEGDDYLLMNRSKAKADANEGDDYLPMNSLKAEADANEGDDYLPMNSLKADADNNEGDDYLPMNGLKADADNNKGDDYLPMNRSKAEADANEGDDYLPMDGLKAEAANNEGDDYLPMKGLKAEADADEGDDYLPMNRSKAEADANEWDDYLPMDGLKAEAANNEGDDYLPMKGLKAEADADEGDDYLPMNRSKAEADANEGDDYLPMDGLKAEAANNEGDDYLPMKGLKAEADADEGDDYLPMNRSKAEADANEWDDYLPMDGLKAEAANNEGDDYLPMKGLKAEADGNEGDDYLPMNSSKAKADDNAGDDYLPMNSLKAEADANEGDDYLPMDGLKAEAANNEGDDYLPMKGLKAETDNNEGDDYLPMKDLKAEADNNEGEDYLPMKVLKAEADNNEGDDYLPMNGLKAEADNNEGDDYLPMNGLKAEADNNEGDDYLPMKDLKAEADNNERDDYLPMKDLKAEADNNEGDDYLPMKGLKAETDYNERDDYLPMNGSNAESNAYEGGDYLPMKGLKSEADANEGDDYLPMNGLKAEADANEGDDYLPMYGLKAEANTN